MNRTQIAIALGVAALLLAAGAVAVAQTSPSYNLEWHVVGGGGEPVSSAHYAVNSTAGQGAASPRLSFGHHYAVSGGYWFPAGPWVRYEMYLPIVLKKP